jgi:hypothetical protein
VKKEGKVFTRNVEVEKEMTVARLTPEGVEQKINQIPADILDSYFLMKFSQCKEGGNVGGSKRMMG